MGLLRCRPAAWAQIKNYLNRQGDEAINRLDMTALLSALINQGMDIRGVPVRGQWCELDHPKDLETYERMLSQPRPWTHDWRAMEHGT